MTETKTKPTQVKVTDFVSDVQPQQKKEDAQKLLEIMKEISGQDAVMWGPSIIGFGKYHYKYDSGHEGEMCRIGFSPRKANLVLYLMPSIKEHKALLDTLGKHKTSVACLYINKLTDVDIKVLKKLIKKSWEEMQKLYPSQ